MKKTEVWEPILAAFIIGIGASLVAALIVAAFPYRHNLVGSMRCFLLHRDGEVRVSMAALLCVRRDDQFLLIRNHYRRETFGPIGGVYKYYASAKETLDRCCFSPQARLMDLADDLKSDLRGFVPGKNMPTFIRWFVSGKQREVEPLTREIQEELVEIGLIDRNFDQPFKFDLIRTIYEGPTRVPGVAYLQFRFFQIYQFASDCEAGQELTSRLFTQVPLNQNLISATSVEIRRRRASSGEFIGEHSCYLLGNTRIRIEPAPFG